MPRYTTPHRRTSRRVHAGFSLLEAMIVLGLVAALLAVGATWLSYQNQSQQREGHSDSLARDMAMLTSATQKYLATNPAAVTALAPNTTLTTPPTIAQLITDGHLPANFANRYGAVGTSPYGQPYAIVVRRASLAAPSTGTVVRAVVYEGNTPSATALERSGMQNTPQQVYALKAKAATEAQKDFKIVSAILPVGTREARSPTNSFTENLADYFGTNFPANQLGALVNFDHLNPDPCTSNPSAPGCTGGTGSPLASGTNCIVLPPQETAMCSSPHPNAPEPNLAGHIFPVAGTTSLNNTHPPLSPETSLSSGVDSGVLGSPSRGVTLSLIQYCSAARTPTCPYGKTVAQSIPAKCVNPLGPTANARIPNYTTRICEQVFMSNGTFQCSNYFAHWGMVSMQGMIPGSIWRPTWNTTLIAHGNPMLSDVLVEDPPSPWQGDRVATSDLMFSPTTHVPELIGTPAGPGTTGWTPETSLGHLPQANFRSSLIIAGQQFSATCANWSGKYTHDDQRKYSSLALAYRDDMKWTLCCDP